MFVINPDAFLLPTYRISPFQTSSIHRNRKISKDYEKVATQYFNRRFGENHWLLTLNGREAIALAMQSINLSKKAKTTILTPSNNLYISSCVTSTIEKFTHWNRKKSEESDIYFVNHEFGYLYQEMGALSEENIPIIEDCCTTFFSQNKNKKIGKYGDFSVYSFPKFFSIQIGGLLASNNVEISEKLSSKSLLTEQEKHYVLRVMGYEISIQNEVLARRVEVWRYALKQYENMGFSLRFPTEKDIVPSVLLLNNNRIISDLSQHKEFLNNHGIQNSVFYGEDAFFVPCHQNMNESDVDYLVHLTKKHIKG